MQNLVDPRTISSGPKKEKELFSKNVYFNRKLEEEPHPEISPSQMFSMQQVT